MRRVLVPAVAGLFALPLSSSRTNAFDDAELEAVDVVAALAQLLRRGPHLQPRGEANEPSAPRD